MIRPLETLCGCLSGSERQIIVLIHQIETDIFKYGICASMPLLEYLVLIDSP